MDFDKIPNVTIEFGNLIHKIAEISVFFQCVSEQAVDQNESIFYKASLFPSTLYIS